MRLLSSKTPKLSGKKSQQKEPPTENLDIKPGQEKGGTSEVQGEEGWTICITFTVFY